MVDTIVAIATPPGRGGVGIIRMSGPNAYAIASQLTHLQTIEARKVLYCAFYDSQQVLLDEGILLYFKAPHSFTGEDVIELQAHGAPVVLDNLVRTCITLGARIAKPGEFSERAFLNDKIDLTQAEAIADLIQASSETAARMAVRSLQGDFSKQIHELNEALIHLRLFVEAAIDFPEEEIDFLNDGKIANMLNAVIDKLQYIMRHARQGVLLREGITVVIAGKPNAGKSTLINRLAGKEVAIVTALPGTTRDVMREHILLDDIPLHIVDTAGLRDSDCLIEKEGIKRAWQEISEADCLLLVTDVNLTETSESALLHDNIMKQLPSHVPMIRVFNKIDQLSVPPTCEEEGIYLSAKTGEGIDSLKEKIKEMIGYQVSEGQFLARRRHIDALEKAHSLLTTGHYQLNQHRAGELLAEDLRLAHQSLCEITGEFSSDDLLGKIFSSFCIGK